MVKVKSMWVGKMSYGTDHWGMGENYKRKMLLWTVLFKLGLDDRRMDARFRVRLT